MRIARPVLLTLALSILLLPAAQAARTLVSFQYPTKSAAQQAWQPGEHAKNVWPQKDGSGLTFPCPFTRNVDRYYWDLDCRLDLSRDSSLALQLRCDAPEAARTISLYFRSGEGWYHWSRPVRGAGTQWVTINKSDCGIEGTPVGWHRIDGIRFSPWKGSGTDTHFVLQELQARNNRILLVQGTRSTPNADERKLSQRSTRLVGRLLDDAGVDYGTVDDDGVAAGALASAKVAVLCYNPQPGGAMLRQLEKFLTGGGKLIVLGSGSPGLARLLGVRLDPFLAAGRPGRWSSIQFIDAEERNRPQSVHQIAWGMVPAHPANASVRVTAHWADANGRPTPQAAWLEGPKGAWMTQVMRDDDMQSKQRMLISLLGHYSKETWQQAARHALATTGRVGPYADLPAAVQAFRSANEPGVRAAAKEAAALHRAMSRQFAAGTYADVVATGHRLQGLLVRAYGMKQDPRPNELRGIWDHDGCGWYPGDWDRSCRIMADAGFNAIFPNLVWPGRAHYASAFLPGSKTLELFGDQLEQCVAAADRHGLQVHVWKVCWNLGHAPPEYLSKLKKQGRLQKDAAGRTKNWLCPSHPKNLAHEVRSVAEICRKYDVDGIHLDYIRFPSAGFCFDETCRNAFEAQLGRSIDRWPESVQAGGRHEKAFRTWRADQITRFVREARTTLKGIRPEVQLSAAVYRRYPSCRDSLGQDWGRWIEEGLVDFVCPMSYTEDPLNFTNVTRDQLALPGARNAILPGIGVTSSESQLTPDQVIDQIGILRRLGARGFVLFDLSGTLRDDVLPTLRLGTTRP